MRRTFSHGLVALVLLFLAPMVIGQPEREPLPETSPLPVLTSPAEDGAVLPGYLSARPLKWEEAAILGLVEGLTEYLPVSSTGHLIITNDLLGLDQDLPLANPQTGQPVFLDRDPDEIMTLKQAVDAYAIVIQAGAIAAVVLLYWGRLWTVLMGFLGRDRNGLRLGRNLIVAFLPAVVLGLLLEELIDTYLFEVWPVIAALFAGGLLMLGVEWWRKRHGTAHGEGPDLHDLTIRQSLVIGLFQCVAMWPGTSRSMMTIVGGYVAGLNPARAAEFSFLLGLPTLSGAALYKGIKTGPPMLEAFGWLPIMVGIVVATVSAAIAVRFLVAWLTTRGLNVFAWYRMIVAVVLLALGRA